MRGFLDRQGKFIEIGRERHHDWAVRAFNCTEEHLTQELCWLRIVVGPNDPIFAITKFNEINRAQWEWLEDLLYERKHIVFDVTFEAGYTTIGVRLEKLDGNTLEEYMQREIRLRTIRTRNGKPLFSGHGGTESGLTSC